MGLAIINLPNLFLLNDETVRELDQLYVELGMADETHDDAIHGVCDTEFSE